MLEERRHQTDMAMVHKITVYVGTVELTHESVVGQSGGQCESDPKRSKPSQPETETGPPGNQEKTSSATEQLE
jgi:hypothetical protein